MVISVFQVNEDINVEHMSLLENGFLVLVERLTQ